MHNRRVLISGASVAGPTLAYWLHHHGFEPTVVEKAPTIRPGGQAIDIRGTALDVTRRMGLLEQARAACTAMRGMSYVDENGTELFSTTEATLTGGDVDSPDIEILRDDLAGILYEATRSNVEYVFDDSIASLTQHEDHVQVTFERSAPRTFDLVVGADGLHSATRALAFGPEADFIHHLGTNLAVFTSENFLDLDHWQVYHQTSDGLAGLYSARNNTEARGMLGFLGQPLGTRDVHAQKRAVAEHFAQAGWEVPQLIKQLWEAPDFHFDSMSQIVLPSWSAGRVTLVGDAGYCASPLSGQGTSLALTGAYVLAGELAAAGGDHVRAFARYEATLRPYVEANQAFALAMSAWQQDQSTPQPSIHDVSSLLELPTYP
ncbi:FAD-dependent monooxygenase [Tenggerimyces flavus]|uniref:FAD-dependent monooxygenase n=1 Tax=Tenggerimyces flavus TaxID=1708749 RepID=A0ABV7Y5U6_9ACTN|nr:FAD-dependent monooxygenase [Tenggerimyces flavus]MBM7785089.1 2-polyprenyl-6-methoxyphenol hydroxylase-like FAD-dependent oxidoreductase [Tenggerimyces flavus]